MTIIEYYSDIALENAVSTLAFEADETILIYDSNTPSARVKLAADALRALFARKIPSYRRLTLIPMTVSDIDGNANVIAQIAREKDQCIFDLTGGTEPIMVSMGMAAERLGAKRIHMHLFELREGRSTCCSADNVHPEKSVSVGVSELIELNGGECTCQPMQENADFSELVKTLWEISRRDPTAWNRCIYLLNTSRGMAGDGAHPLFAGRMRDLDVQRNSDACREMVAAMIAVGAMRQQEGRLYFANHAVKECLLKNGTVFELASRTAAADLLRRMGQYFHGAVESEVVIHWFDTRVKNEIDVVFMKGLIPVFVSCKNGAVDDEELYKFKAVSEQFGGEEGIKLLLVSPPNPGDNTESFLTRARHLGIHVMCNVRSMTIGQLSHEMEQLVSRAIRRM